MQKETVTKIYQQYPKALVKFEEYIRQQMNVDVGGDKEVEKIKAAAMTQTTNAVKVMLQAWDRVLYEFFDEQDIRIGITPFSSVSDEWGQFYWKVRYKSGMSQERAESVGELGSKISRREAEEEAFVCAFKLLEGRL